MFVLIFFSRHLNFEFKRPRSLEHFFLTVGQNNFGNKIPLFILFSGTAMVCMMTRSVIDDEETFDSSSNTSPVHGKIDLGMDFFIDGQISSFCPNQRGG